VGHCVGSARQQPGIARRRDIAHAANGGPPLVASAPYGANWTVTVSPFVGDDLTTTVPDAPL
jgi:hypothetical protein